MSVELVIALIAGAVLAVMFLYLYMEQQAETAQIERKEPVETPRNDDFRNS